MARSKIITYENPKSPTAEAYRTLRTNIQFSSIDKTIKSIVVTSVGPGEGKSTVTVNTAVTMAQAEKKVLLIDCDLRKPKIHTFLGYTMEKGLRILLQETWIIRKQLKQPKLFPDWILLLPVPSRRIPPNLSVPGR